ncbi:MAG: protecting protein DprA protein [Parcubacteria group bacterium GW2011_GWA2_43_11]|nr:MAG: protecting protein DprA protein [Parcubacteria group bacterium GW2011_GWC2_42_11]KKS85813.1 MAG: protecting protein DprA protein [Parcubacteria group bacterium GW2011_GWA2_43_11]
MPLEEMYPIQTLAIPALLQEITDAPKKLTVRGTFPTNSDLKFLSVVGSRKYTSYGRQACETLIHGLRGYPVVIVSGLALGIDGIAHQAALDASLTTVAVPASGLSDSVLYPATHRKLARDILDQGGALVSEFAPDWRPRLESFPQRNRIMAGMSHAVLVVEAEYKSGTLITSKLAGEYNRDVLAIPGPIHSTTSQGTHMLIQKGAALIASSGDILDALGIRKEDLVAQCKIPLHLTAAETSVFALLHEPLFRDTLVQKLKLPVSEANILLASLELKGYITERLGKVEWRRN